MAVIDIFSKRNKRELEGEIDVYQYTDISRKFRVQAVHIIDDVIGQNVYGYDTEVMYKLVKRSLCKEYGVFELRSYSSTNKEEVLKFLAETEDYDKALDVVELCFKIIDIHIRNVAPHLRQHVPIGPDEAIEEINIRFKENGIGYRYESGQLIRMDSELIHNELIKPTLGFLNCKKYINSNEEYLRAFEHFKHGRNKECLVDCLKAFESVMKIICDNKGWKYNQNDTAKKLINLLYENGLVPTYMQNHITSLRTLLENGIPTLRNKLGGHGQGVSNTLVDDYVANYALNLTASNIKYLIELEKLVQ